MESHPEPLIGGYNVHRESDRRAMLEALGLSSIEELFSPIPEEVRLGRELHLPPPHSEWALGKHLRELAARNATPRSHLCFLGGGVSEHHIPAVVDSLCSSEELLTAYTPYQPEMSQGLLQILFEYQRMVSLLTGLRVVDSSLYDGATAMAEAAWMACAATGQRRILVSSRIWPETSLLGIRTSHSLQDHFTRCPLPPSLPPHSNQGRARCFSGQGCSGGEGARVGCSRPW